MNRCLSERALVALHCGDGSDTDRAHVRVCRACDARYARLTQDLTLISRVLSEPPPPRASAYRLIPRGMRWAPVAVALVGMMALTLAVPRLWSPSPVRVASATASAAVFADDVSAALFAVPNAPTLTLASADIAPLQAALTGGSPCTSDQLFNGECDDQFGALLSEGD